MFDTTKSFLYQMVGWGVLSRVLGVTFNCIGPTCIQVCCNVGNDYKVFPCFVIYVTNAILYLDLFVLALISFSGLHSCVENFTRGMFVNGDMCLRYLFCVKRSLSLIVFSYIWELEHIPMEDICIRVRQRKLDYMP